MPDTVYIVVLCAIVVMYEVRTFFLYSEIKSLRHLMNSASGNIALALTLASIASTNSVNQEPEKTEKEQNNG